MYEFKLPDLGEGIHEGEILKWLVKPGDVVKLDQDIVEVETDKAAVSLPSPAAGRIVSVTGGSGDMVKTGEVIVVIDDGSTLNSVKASPPKETAVSHSKRAVTPGKIPVPAAPATRRLAREMQIDLNKVNPSGQGGRVTSEDVISYSKTLTADSPALIPEHKTDTAPTSVEGNVGIPFYKAPLIEDFSKWGEVERTPIRSIRKRTAERMVASMTIVPHVAHMEEIDLTDLENLRRKYNTELEESSKSLTTLSFVIKAVTAALKEYSSFNASLDHKSMEIVHKRFYNIGFAADTPNGLIVPVIQNANSKSIEEISANLRELSASAKEGSISVEKLKGGTFTITNIGAIGGTGMIPAINYPEVAILGLGRIQRKPIVIDEKIEIRTLMPITLAFDHRVTDGADAAKFVNYFKRTLQNPTDLLIKC